MIEVCAVKSQNPPKGPAKKSAKKQPQGRRYCPWTPATDTVERWRDPNDSTRETDGTLSGAPSRRAQGSDPLLQTPMITCAKIKYIKHISGPVTVPVDTRQCRVCVKTATYCTYCASQIMRIKLIACETDTEEWKGRKVLVKS